MAWTVAPRSNELMLAVRRRGDGLVSGGAVGCPLAMRFDLLAAVQLQGNFKRLRLLRIIALAAAAARPGRLLILLLVCYFR